MEEKEGNSTGHCTLLQQEYSCFLGIFTDQKAYQSQETAIAILHSLPRRHVHFFPVFHFHFSAVIGTVIQSERERERQFSDSALSLLVCLCLCLCLPANAFYLRHQTIIFSWHDFLILSVKLQLTK